MMEPIITCQQCTWKGKLSETKKQHFESSPNSGIHSCPKCNSYTLTTDEIKLYHNNPDCIPLQFIDILKFPPNHKQNGLFVFEKSKTIFPGFFRKYQGNENVDLLGTVHSDNHIGFPSYGLSFNIYKNFGSNNEVLKWSPYPKTLEESDDSNYFKW